MTQGFEVPSCEAIGNGVTVPNHIFKAIYDPQAGAAYVVGKIDNSPVDHVTIASLDTLTGVSRISSFPGCGWHSGPAATGDAITSL